MKGERFINVMRRFILKPYQKYLRILRHSFGNYLNANRFAYKCKIALNGQEIDICISHDVFALKAGLDIKHAHRAMMVADLVEIPFVKRRSGQYFRDTPAIGAFVQDWQHHRAIKKADTILSIGKSMANFIETSLDVTVMPLRNCHEAFDLAAGTSIQDLIGVGPETKTLCYVNSLGDGYGLESTILALQHLPKHVHLVCIGTFTNDAFQAKVMNLIDTFNLQNRIHFLPIRDQKEYISLVSTADIGLLLLETKIENMRLALPNRFFDFLKAGLPIIASEIEEVVDYIDKYEIGYVVRKRDPQNLASIIEQTLDANVYDKMKSNILRVRENFIWDQEIKILEILANQTKKPSKCVCILANKIIVQNMRIIKMAKFFSGMGYKVIVLSLGKPAKELQEIVPDCKFIEISRK
jgi:glycosyltransferase involved in cell wall biosynthesis